MGSFKIILFCSFFLLAACNSGSSASEKRPLIKKMDANRTCIPESELLAINILGGQLVQPEDSDSKTVMMLVSRDQSVSHMCTAVAIGKKVLLTAAHCIVGNKMNTYVSFYPSQSCESGYNKNLYNKGVSETIINESYDSNSKPENMVGDIALVILEEEIPVGYEIFKIAIPEEVDESSDLYFYGYGITDSQASGSRILRKTQLNHSLYKFLDDKKIEVDQTGGKGICQGDSGGPGFVKTKAGEMQILGINSYVYGPEDNICAKNSYQTWAHFYRKWINDKLAEREKALR